MRSKVTTQEILLTIITLCPQEVAYYQDLDRMVPLKVEATIKNGVVKRTLVCKCSDTELLLLIKLSMIK